MRSLTLKIDGLNCASCVARVEKVLQNTASVDVAYVNLATKSATVSGAGVSSKDISEILSGAGYPPKTDTIRLAIDGMSCASCVGRVERILTALDGVMDAHVNLATKEARLTVLVGMPVQEAAVRALSDAGYPVSPPDTEEPSARSDANTEIAALRHATLVAALLTLPVFILEMGSHMIPAVHHWIIGTLGIQSSRLIQFALTTAVLLGPGLVFFKKGFPAFFRGTPDMNSLVAIGTIAAWGFSTVATFAPSVLPEGRGEIYFEAAAVIVTLILLGRYLEARAKGRTGEAIARLVGLSPNSAWVERDGDVVETSIEKIVVGDILYVRPGERIAVDGSVIAGRSFVDESMVTGEPIPTLKEAGDTVIAGTINESGSFRLSAESVGADTLLSQIIRMVEDAQGARLPIQQLVNTVTGWFVPAVIAIATVTLGAWLLFGAGLGPAIVAAVSVLIIACPCAMGLATPTSIMVGTGRAAELGVLFRKGDALQTLSRIDTVAFDKTGTLTAGKPELTTFEVADGFDRDETLCWVAAVEANSEHPIASAITRAAPADTLPRATEFSATSGMGVSAIVDGHQVHVGADRFMAHLNVNAQPLASHALRIASDGQTPFFAAIDGTVAAVIGVSDPVKEDAESAIFALKTLGLKTVLISGDNARTAHAVAAQLGIEDVVAEVLPAGKTEALNTMKSAGARIAFVGDGINDAPALAHADVGIAMGTGTDVAIETADVVLIAGNPGAVVRALEISRATMRNIRQNLGWAFGYNALLIPVAAGVLYPVWGVLLSPSMAAGAMALSSVAVVTNALRLKRFGKTPTARTKHQTSTLVQQAAE